MKFEISDVVTISKYKNIFAKDYISNWSEEVFVIKKVKYIVPWTNLISYLKNEEILWKRIAKNKLKRFGKVIKRKGDKLYLNGKAVKVLLTVGLIKKR